MGIAIEGERGVDMADMFRFDQRLRKRPLVPLAASITEKGVEVVNKTPLVKAISEAVPIVPRLEVSTTHHVVVEPCVNDTLEALEDDGVPLIGRPVRVQLGRLGREATATRDEIKGFLVRSGRYLATVEELVGFVNVSAVPFRQEGKIILALGTQISDKDHGYPLAVGYSYDKTERRGHFFALPCVRIRPEWLFLMAMHEAMNAA